MALLIVLTIVSGNTIAQERAPISVLLCAAFCDLCASAVRFFAARIHGRGAENAELTQRTKSN
jgi:hypothetical protein